MAEGIGRVRKVRPVRQETNEGKVKGVMWTKRKYKSIVDEIHEKDNASNILTDQH